MPPFDYSELPDIRNAPKNLLNNVTSTNCTVDYLAESFKTFLHATRVIGIDPTDLDFLDTISHCDHVFATIHQKDSFKCHTQFVSFKHFVDIYQQDQSHFFMKSHHFKKGYAAQNERAIFRIVKHHTRLFELRYSEDAHNYSMNFASWPHSPSKHPVSIRMTPLGKQFKDY